MSILCLPGVPGIQWFSSQQQQGKNRPLLQFFWKANVEELWSSQAYLRHQQQTTSIQIRSRQDLSEPVLSSSSSWTCHWRQPLLCELFISMWDLYGPSILVSNCKITVFMIFSSECNLGFCFVELCSCLPGYLQCQFDSVMSWINECANSIFFKMMHKVMWIATYGNAIII